jgi:hypothetical protein
MLDPDLAAELERLSPAERAWAEDQLALRTTAQELATRLGLDPDEVFVILRQLRRSPSERLLIGLRHGRFTSAHR